MYIGFYYASVDKDSKLYSRFPKVQDKNKKRISLEFGFSGPISKKNDKFTYDLAAVKHKDTGLDANGWLKHVAIKYDSKQQFRAKVAYTVADKGFSAGMGVENSNRWYDGEETIFEDMMLTSFALTGGLAHLDSFISANLTDMKLELGYTLKNHDKHSFRLAYDHVKNTKDNVMPEMIQFAIPNYLTGADFKSIKMNLITFEYTYKLAKNTRIRLGYQINKMNVDMGKLFGKPKTNLYYTEIFTKF